MTTSPISRFLRGALPGAMAALVLLGASQSRAEGLTDSNILSIFDQANMADITTARLGFKKGQSQKVRDLAAMVMSDHEAVQAMGRALAKDQGLVASPPDNDGAPLTHAQAYERLQGLSGAAFDAAYLEHEIAFHQGVIDAIEGILLPSIQNAELKGLVEKVLPGFQHHLAETQRVAQELGVN